MPEFLSYAGEDTLFDITCRRFSEKLVFNRKAFLYWHAPKEDSAIWHKYYNWGIGDGENGVGDFGFYPPVRLQKSGLPILLPTASLQWKAFFLGYLEGKTKRGFIDRVKRNITETILLVLENPLFMSTSSITLIKSMIDSGRRVVAISCLPTSPPYSHAPIFLNFDISLLELHYNQHFSLEQFWGCYGGINLSRISLAKDKDNAGLKSKNLFDALSKSIYKFE
jgi:hypothetical protein